MLLPYKGIKPKLHETVFAVDSAQIIGDVEIGEDSSVWFNAVVRADVHYIRIGKRTNIQDNCTVHVTNGTHPTVLGDDITVGHGVIIHGATVKDRCLLGMGSIILDNTVIGEDCIIGAGALVTEGARIAPRSLVLGVPGKVVRALTDEEVKRILKSAGNYIEYVASYRE